MGYTFAGPQDEYSYFRIGTSGDFNGDGINDLLIGDTHSGDRGYVYIVDGTSLASLDALDGSVDDVIQIASIPGAPGTYTVTGIGSQEHLGNSVSFVGDLDGDTLDDIMFGNATYLLPAADLAAADAADGSEDGIISWASIPGVGEAYKFTFAAKGVSLGDLDGDGAANFALSYGGKILFLQQSALASADAEDGLADGYIDQVFLEDTFGGYTLTGLHGGKLAALDVDGDGQNELFIDGVLFDIDALAAADAADGAADLAVTLQNIADLTGSYSFINGYSNDAYCSAGDVDGDGKEDFLFGASATRDLGQRTGSAYLLLSSELSAADAADGNLDGTISLANAAEQAGSYRFVGDGPGGWFGYSVSSAGDVDGDGSDEFLIAAIRDRHKGGVGGAVYLIDGEDLAAADAADGTVDGTVFMSHLEYQPSSYKFLGDANGFGNGAELAQAGDLDGDGRDDFVIANVPFYDDYEPDEGEVVVVYSSLLEAYDAADGVTDGAILLSNVSVISAAAAVVPSPGAGDASFSNFRAVLTTNETDYGLNVAYTVENPGTSGRAAIVLSDDAVLDAGDTVLFREGFKGATGGGKEYETVHLTLPGNTSVGSHWLFVVAELLPDGSGFADNQSVFQFEVPAPRDATEYNDTIRGTPSHDTIDGLRGNDTITGLGGNDSLIGGLGNDRVTGGSGNDTLEGGFGRDTLEGGEDADEILGGDHDDSLNGGSGNDVLAGEDGDDTVSGGADDDTVSGGVGNDMLLGNSGNDDLTGDQGDDTLDGGPGDDDLDGGIGNDTLLGDLDNDTLSGGDGADSLYGEFGDDWLSGGLEDDGLFGSAGDDVLEGDEGNDTLDGGDDDDTLIGGAGVDQLRGGYGADSAEGGDDNDTILGGYGNDTLSGGAGADSINGGEDDDHLFGGADDDLILGGGGADLADGGDGADEILGGAGSDSISGGEGADTIRGEDEDDRLYGDTGNDSLDGGSGADSIEGGDGDDLIMGGTGTDSVDGGIGSDEIFGQSAADLLKGGGDDDQLRGGAGIDTLHGDEGRDILIGNTASDVLYGGAGEDSLYGSEGRDTLIGGDDADLLMGGTGADHIEGREGSDTAYGSAGSDALFGGAGNDFLNGATGADSISGGSGDDTLIGSQGFDTLLGGSGNDSLSGGSLTDMLDGGTGNDTLNGGRGADILIFNNGCGMDVVEDFEADLDLLSLSLALTGGLTDAEEIIADYGDDSTGVVIFDFGGGDTITLANLTTLTGLDDNIGTF